jgi:outer membrane protein OmpA-like peptidoglycan-associated protein
MRLLSRSAMGVVLIAIAAVPAVAQAQSGAQPQSQEPAAQVETRPATTTTIGDTGLWFTPTAEVLPKGRFSASAYRVNFDRTEAFTDVSDFRGNFAFGATDRLEIFGGITVQRRIDADRRPVRSGGTPVDYPNVFEDWTTGVGDVIVGAKLNLMSQWRQSPASLAIRGAVKVPAASFDDGLGTRKPDFSVDLVLSREMASIVEMAGYVGGQYRGDPDNFELTHGARWGAGLSFPSRSPLRLVGEVDGEYYFDKTIAFTGPQTLQIGGNTFPSSWDVDHPVDAHIGLTFQHPNGFFLGGGLNFGLDTKNRGQFLPDGEFGDRAGWQFRLGYHPGVRVYVAPAAPAPAPPPPAPANRPPTVKARCEPCTIEVGKTSTVTADAQDPDGDTLSYKWSAPTGTFANPADRQTIFTCPQQEGSVPVTVTVSDGKGGTASDTITIQCVRPPRKEYTFEDVHFDFDRYSLRTEATRILDEAVKAMQADPELRITVEGHTCNIGTAEYNLALGERRSNAVRDYLSSRGIAATRLQTVSYGEERPKHDNSREETRRLNRRAALTVRLQ